MVNYKTDARDRFDIGGFKHILKTGDKIKYMRTMSQGTTESVKDLETGIDYVVPTGKQTWVFYHQSSMGTVNQANEYYGYTDAVDDSTGITKLFEPGLGVLSDKIYVSAKIPEGKYLTFVMLQVNTCEVIAIEEDA